MKKLIAGLLTLSMSGVASATSLITTDLTGTTRVLPSLEGWRYKAASDGETAIDLWVRPSAELGSNYQAHYRVEKNADGFQIEFTLLDSRSGEELASHAFAIPQKLDIAARAAIEAEFRQFWSENAPIELSGASSNAWLNKVTDFLVPSAHAGWAEVSSLAPGILMGGGFVAVLLGLAVGVVEKFVGGLWGALSGGNKDTFPVVGTVIGVGGAVSFIAGAAKTCELILR